MCPHALARGAGGGRLSGARAASRGASARALSLSLSLSLSLACALLLALAPLGASRAAPAPKKPRVGVMVFARDGVPERLRAQVERKLRDMVQFADASGAAPGRLYPLELFFDVGELSKANLHTAERHFNEAQRALEAGESEEAKEQLFRARRFYLKGVPFVRDEALLQSIFYFDYITHKNLKIEKKARELYCQYVSLSRNLTGSVGPIEQYDALVDICGESPISGTAELSLTADVDGAHVFVNNTAVGVVDRTTPYIAPFMSAGVHLVEVRKLGYARWGTLITLENGKSKKFKATLKRAKNYDQDFAPFDRMPLRGPEVYSDTYLAEFFYEASFNFGIDALLAVYLEPASGGQVRFTAFSFRREALEPRFEVLFNGQEPTGYYAALSAYWRSLYQADLDPASARDTQARWQPTLFKVE